MITSRQFQQLTGLTLKRSDEILAAFLTYARRYNVLNMDVLEEFLANLLHESGNFTIMVENLNYTTSQRLVAIWPSRFTITNEPGKHNARNFVRNPRLLANTVYNGRMGNRVGTDDGFNYRGGGFAQITGLDAYQQFTTFINRRDNTNLTINQVANLVQTDTNWAMDSAYWFFCEFKNLEQLAINDDYRTIVLRWNGGFIGMPDRLNKLNQIKALFK